MTRPTVTAAEARALLHYDPETGVLCWRRNVGQAKAGEEAGCVNCYGYRHLKIAGRYYRSHRIAWLITHGVWPSKVIDHINRVKTDNRLCNLRDVTQQVNALNRGPYEFKSGQPGGLHGRPGVSWLDRAKRWRAVIYLRGKQKHLGLFTTADAASNAYEIARRERDLANT